MPVWICAACAVEQPAGATPPDVCPICLDERQYVPRSGQSWHSLDELRSAGYRNSLSDVEPDLFGIVSEPEVGIGQRSLLVRTPHGNLLWDPVGYVDDEGAEAVRAMGEVVAIVASHPHMYGAQLEWSERLGDAPVYVADADRNWLQRDDGRVRTFSGVLEIVPGLSVHTIGGHFPGSCVAVWSDGADGRGALLTGDTLFPGPSGRSVSFMRSFPNLIPLSAAVVRRVADAVLELEFDRVYGNFGGVVQDDGQAVVAHSADRYIEWVSGEHDADT